MRFRNLFLVLLGLVMTSLTGCGGSGGSTASGPTVGGVAMAGPVRNGHFQAFEIFSSQNPSKSHLSATPFFSGTTGADGSYTIPLPPTMKDGILVAVTDGAYFDEATQADKHVETEYPGGMRAAFGNMAAIVAAGQHARMHVTPFTELAVRLAGGSLDDNAVKQAHDQVEHAFGLDTKGIDIDNTEPFDPSAAPPAGATDDRKAYSKALAVLSEFEKDSGGGKSMSGVSDDLIAEMQGNNGLLTAGTSSKMSSAELNYDNSGNNKTGVASSAVPVLTLSASKSVATNDGVDAITLSANVTLSGANLAGAEVKFAIKSGSGSLSQKSVLTDASGIAAVSLTSLVDGDLDVVTATVGGSISVDSSSLSFVNPNKPGAIVLSANPTSGTTLAGGGVTLTAKVSPVSTSGAIADGTLVTFSITSGTGTLSAITTTTGGSATATLSASTANTVTVTASAGSAVSSSLSVNFINQPTLAIVKIGTSGTLGAGQSVGAINAKVTYPTAGLTIAAADVAGSGLGATSTLVPNTTVAGTVTLGLLNPTGIQVGEFATLTFHIAVGTFPKLSDFGIAAGTTVIDATTNAALPGIGATVLSLTLQ